MGVKNKAEPQGKEREREREQVKEEERCREKGGLWENIKGKGNKRAHESSIHRERKGVQSQRVEKRKERGKEKESNIKGEREGGRDHDHVSDAHCTSLQQCNIKCKTIIFIVAI